MCQNKRTKRFFTTRGLTGHPQISLATSPPGFLACQGSHGHGQDWPSPTRVMADAKKYMRLVLHELQVHVAAWIREAAKAQPKIGGHGGLGAVCPCIPVALCRLDLVTTLVFPCSRLFLPPSISFCMRTSPPSLFCRPCIMPVSSDMTNSLIAEVKGKKQKEFRCGHPRARKARPSTGSP